MTPKLVFDIAQLDNLRTLHEHEEKIRADSLKLLNADQETAEILFLVANSMGVIFGFVHDHPAKSDDELTIQYLGIRLFNAAATSIKLALSGYPQNAFASIRDILEVALLVDFLGTHPEKISEWKAADKKTRIEKFGPGTIRNALDKRDGRTDKKRKEQYDRLSEYASHASYAGFALVNHEGSGHLGPILDKLKLRAWAQEIALRLVPSAVLIGMHFPEAPELALGMLKALTAQGNEWFARNSKEAESK